MERKRCRRLMRCKRRALGLSEEFSKFDDRSPHVKESTRRLQRLRLCVRSVFGNWPLSLSCGLARVRRLMLCQAINPTDQASGACAEGEAPGSRRAEARGDPEAGHAGR